SAAARELGEWPETLDRVVGRTVQPVIAKERTRVYLRVATEAWFGEEDRAAFEEAATAAAGEPIDLALEQVLAADGDVDEFAGLLGRRPAGPATRLPDLFAPLEARIDEALRALTFPPSAVVAGAEVVLGDGGRRTLRVGYASEFPLPPEAEAILRSQLLAFAADSTLRVELVPVPTTPSPLAAPADSARLREAVDYLRRFGRLQALLTGPPAPTDSVRARLLRLGADPDRVRTDSAGLPLRLTLQTQEEARAAARAGDAAAP
ncbi:MAG: hypothetical protein R3362_07600, partial [Rhodothermales bacterium]|nr:hypothetical protein [Rhodothermales bacterium]